MPNRNSEIADRLVYFFGLADNIPERKRRLFLGMLVLGIVLLTTDTLLGPIIQVDLVNSIGNVLMAVFLATAAWFLWRRRERQELILFAVFFGSSVYLLLIMLYNLASLPAIVGSEGVLRTVSPWLVWFILVEMTCFLTFRANSALRIALLVTVLFLLILGFAILKMPTLPPTTLHDLGLLIIANALVIFMAYPLAQSQEQSGQTDFLTSLANRSHGYNALLAEIERARRYDDRFSIILFDIDHFKNINDTCGHPCGDAVLREVASFVNERIRRTDLLSRWGGEEFLLLMTRCDLASARLKAEHLRQQIKNRPFHQSIHLTASFGITAYYPYDTANTLLERVDDALYRAKRNGRNCVETE